MIHLPWRLFTGRITFQFQNGLHLQSQERREFTQTPISSHAWWPNFLRHTGNRRDSIRLTHSDELAENLADGKTIPITIVTRFLDRKPELKPKESKEKLSSTKSIRQRLESKKCEETVAVKVETENINGASKAVIPYSKNGSLRNEWTRGKPLRPKTNEQDIHFRETYEKLKRLGLLKPRFGNGFVGMTSPSGKYKFETSPTASLKGKTERPAALSELVKKPPKRLPEIKSKFLQNNVVVKVQHFYESQGKEMPEDLRRLTNGRSLRRCPESSGNPQKNKHRLQVYPCTSPSQPRFTKNFKSVK